FDGCNDTPVEVLLVFLLGAIEYMIFDFMFSLKPKNLSQQIASWEIFNPDALDLAYILGKYFVKHFKGLVGKHFKMQCELWSLLCHLAPYVFQTSISNLEQYLETNEQKIETFLHNVIKMSANFHMLVHLPHSIRRFCPASLFAKEKFESFNSVLRKASVNSNRHRPGRDLAVTFANYESIQAVLSWNQIQSKIHQIHSLELDSKNTIKTNSFVQVKNYSGKDNFVSQINSIWAIESSLHTEYELEVTQQRLTSSTIEMHATFERRYLADHQIRIMKVLKSFHSALENCLMANITTDPPTPHQKISEVINSTQRWQNENSRSANLNSLEEIETS
ncbi:hypothetical protein VP01_6487g1, partial [Puccinia sorghi]